MSESDTLYCANHPKRETLIRCGRCEKPICFDCRVDTPVGVRCRECGVYRPVQYQVDWYLYIPAMVVGLVAGALGGFVGNRMGFFSVFFAPVIGTLVGEGISRAAKRKRGVGLALIAGGAIFVGALLIPPLLGRPLEAFPQRLFMQATDFWAWVYIVFAAPAAFWRLR